MEKELFIPQPFAEKLLRMAEESNIPIEEIVTEALKLYIEEESRY